MPAFGKLIFSLLLSTIKWFKRNSCSFGNKYSLLFFYRMINKFYLRKEANSDIINIPLGRTEKNLFKGTNTSPGKNKCVNNKLMEFSKLKLQLICNSMILDFIGKYVKYFPPLNLIYDDAK